MYVYIYIYIYIYIYMKVCVYVYINKCSSVSRVQLTISTCFQWSV